MSIKQPNLSQWKHHAFTWDGINATWYLDGEVFLKGKFDVKPLDFSKDNQVYLTIGRHFNAIEPSIQSGPKFGSLGQLDDVALWNRVLLHEEIRDIFQGSVHLTGNELGLVLLYDFDDEDTVFSSIAKNKGQAGENYDLSLGTVLESPTFASTANTNHLLNFHAPCWVPSTRPSDLPRGKPVVLTVVPSEELEISLPALDSNGGAITVTITSLPQNGTLTSLNGLSINQDDIILPTDENYKVKYQVKEENKDIFAHDVFEYKAQDDDDGNTAFARVFVLRNTAPQALNISAFTIEDRTQSVHLLGSDCDGDQIRTWITRAPTRGKLYNADTLYESDVKQTEEIDLSTLPVLVNDGNIVFYEPPPDESGLRNFDGFGYKVVDPKGQESSEVWVDVSVQPINKLPRAFTKNESTIENKAIIIELEGYDVEGWTIAYSIEQLPKKGKLYRIPDQFDMNIPVTSERIQHELIPMLSENYRVSLPFSPFALGYIPLMSYATKLLNVSSFWGTTTEFYHPYQALGEQKIFKYGETPFIWSPQTMIGDAHSKGGDGVLFFDHDPVKTYELYGYTEYIEFEFGDPVYVREIEIGSPRGMGAVVGIHGWHPENRWSPIWEGEADPRLHAYHHLIQQYHIFRPAVCQTPYKTNRIRIEKDTRTIVDWNYMDFVQLIGSFTLPEGILEYGENKLVYVPDLHEFGDEVIKFAVNDCPFDRFRQSPETNINIWIEPVDDPPIAVDFSVVHNTEDMYTLTTVELKFIDVDGDVNQFELLSLSNHVLIIDPISNNTITNTPYNLKDPRFLIKSKPEFNCELSEDHIEFRVTDEGGQYSEAKIKIDFNCTATFQKRKALETTIYVVLTIVTLFIIATIVVVQKYAGSVIIKSASYLFCNLILFFNILMAVGSILYVISPEKGSYICHLRPWITGISITGVMSNLFVKMDRIRKIFGNKSLKKLIITNSMILKNVVIMLLIETVILTFYSVLGISKAELVLGEGTTSGKLVWQCVTQNSVQYVAWMIIQVLYITFYICSGVIVSFNTKNVPTAFNESIHIGLALFVMIFFGLFLVPLQYLVEDNPDATMLLRAGCQLVCAFCICAALFGPKLYYIYIGKAYDNSMTKSFAVKVTNSNSTSQISAYIKDLRLIKDSLKLKTGELNEANMKINILVKKLSEIAPDLDIDSLLSNVCALQNVEKRVPCEAMENINELESDNV